MSELNHCHPLQNHGSSQMGRLLKALNPQSFQLDERTTQELIVEAQRFAQTLKFYDETNTQPKGAYWDRFWEVEVITYLAIVAAKDTDEIKRQYYELEKTLAQGSTASLFGARVKAQAPAIARYLPLLQNLQELALSLEVVYQKLRHIQHPLQDLLLKRIRRDNCCDQEELEGTLEKLIGFHKAATKLSKTSYENFYANDRHWGLKNQVEYEAIPANPHFSQDDLRELFNTLYNTWLVLKNEAQTSFEAELARMELPEEVAYRVVQPHIVLFLVFLRLFRYAQESLNELGTKHLDFYFEEVLGLKRRAEVPDEVYLLFELAKDFDQHLLEKGTAFSAGKDKNGQPIVFETIEDWVLRPAQVADVKNTWIDADCGGIYGNPDVSKAYNDGQEAPNEQATQWRSMGDDRNLPSGELGFAIASPQLILREGKRVIDVELEINNENEAVFLKNLKEFAYLKVFLSAEETWVELEHSKDIASKTSLPVLSRGAFNVFFVETSEPGQKSKLHIRAILERDDPPIVQLGEELAAAAGFATQWPILKVLIHPKWRRNLSASKLTETTAGLYAQLRNLFIGSITLTVKANDIRENLIIQTDQGVFNGTEKVYPFGPQPEIGHFFYVGSTEVFQKALTELSVKIDWIGPPDDFNAHYQTYNGNFPHLEPKVRIDFIDKADVTSPQPLEKIVFVESELEMEGRIEVMKVGGEVKDLTPSNSTAKPLNVLINDKLVNTIPSSTNQIYKVNLSKVPLNSKIQLATSQTTLTFPQKLTDTFKAYLLPDKAKFSLERNYSPVELEIEISNLNTIDDLKIRIGVSDIDPSPSGKYFVSTGALKNNNLTISSSSHKTTILHTNHFSTTPSNEFEHFSKIVLKLYTDVPGPLPTVSNTIPNAITGVVVNRLGSGHPIAGADVIAFKNGIEPKEAKTDGNGIFKIAIPSGTDQSGWTIQAFFKGARSSRTNNVDAGTAHALQVSDEITMIGFNGTFKGSLKSLDGNKPIWGAKFFAGSTQLSGESDEKDGSFTIEGVDLNTETIKVVHEAFEDAEIEIIDNAEHEVVLVPKPTFFQFQGKVIPFNDPTTGLDGVEVNVRGTSIKVKSASNGSFVIDAPTNLTSFSLDFSKKGFRTITVDLNQLPKPITSITVTLPEENPVNLLLTTIEGKRLKQTIRNEFAVAINSQSINGKRDSRTQEFSRYSPTLKRGFLRFKLLQDDFLHSDYPKVLVNQSVALAKHKEGAIPQIPEIPYTPSTNFISVSYTSVQVITGAQNGNIDQFFHLLPFNGHKQVDLSQTSSQIQLVYPYLPDDTTGTNTAYTPGNLFIGISALQPGSTVALLFQIAGGTALDPEAVLPDIHWSYLARHNRWLPFKTGEIIKDQTHGLTRTGIIQFAIPTQAAKENTMLNPAYFWLRAAARGEKGKVQALPAMQHIRAQVVQVRFKNDNNEPSHLAQPLPAETIANLLESRTAVKKIEQPLESFGGRLPESVGLEYYQRISERLRHKDRGITIWDFEKLLLGHFIELATAKCIPHTRYQPPENATELAPGYLTVAVIPDLKKRKGEPWPEPRFSQGDLNDMRLFLTAHSNVFLTQGENETAQLQVVNPLYEKVDVLANVEFMPGVDKAFHLLLLQTELIHYLSPWLEQLGQAPVFGRKLERSAILQFIEARPYVNFVDVESYQIRMQAVDTAGRPLVFSSSIEGRPATTIKARIISEKICPSTSRSILVAGKVIVGTIENKATLPAFPSKIEPVLSNKRQATNPASAEPVLSSAFTAPSSKRKTKK